MSSSFGVRVFLADDDPALLAQTINLLAGTFVMVGPASRELMESDLKNYLELSKSENPPV